MERNSSLMPAGDPKEIYMGFSVYNTAYVKGNPSYWSQDINLESVHGKVESTVLYGQNWSKTPAPDGIPDANYYKPVVPEPANKWKTLVIKQ